MRTEKNLTSGRNSSSKGKRKATTEPVPVKTFSINLEPADLTEKAVRDFYEQHTTRYSDTAIAHSVEDHFHKPGFLRYLYCSDYILTILGLQGRWAQIALRAPKVVSRVLEKDYGIKGIATVDGEIREQLSIFKIIDDAGDIPDGILIMGDTGTGKASIAEHLHSMYAKAKKKEEKQVPFLRINCGSLTDSLVKSELFGYVRGAFTGANKTTKGILESSNKGILFLDEIDKMPLQGQGAILTFLDLGHFRRVGGTEEISANVKLVCATNKSLLKMARDGEFIEDLYYRISKYLFALKALHDRPIADYYILTLHFLDKFRERSEAFNDKLPIAPATIEKFKELYDWPGNVREFGNVITQLLYRSFATQQPIDTTMFLDQISNQRTIYSCNEDDSLNWIPRRMEIAASKQTSLRLADVTRDHIERVLVITDGNKSEAAKLLGINRKTLTNKLRSSTD